MKSENIHNKCRMLFVICSMVFTLSTKGQDLQSLIDEALTSNPEIQKFDLQYQISKEKQNEVDNIPNTQINLGYFVSESETRTGPQRAKVSLKQMLPWFGTVTARENYMGSLSDAKYEDITIAKRKLIASVSQSYYNLYAIKDKQTVLVKSINLLKTYETLALTAVSVDKASAVDVFRIQIRENELQQLKDVLQQEFLAEQTSLNKLLNRDKSTHIAVIDTLLIPTKLDDISTENLELHPELLKYDKLYDAVSQSELLNQKESSPMIGFGLDYINVSKRPDMDFSDNGKDVLMPMVSLSIPIFNQKYKSVTKQNELMQQEIVAQKQEKANALETALEKAVKQRNSAIISYRTQVENLERAKEAESILLKSYETATMDFDDVLDIQELELKFQMNQIESIDNYYIQSTIINYLSN